MNIVLVWEEVPEETKIILLRDVTPELEAQLRSIAGAYANTTEITNEQDAIIGMISNHLASEEFGGDGAWLPFVIDGKLVDLPTETTLIICGFIL